MTLDTYRGAQVEAVAARLRLTRGPRGSWGPCPVCGAETRSSSGSDDRGPLGIGHGGQGWRCWAGDCGARGDALSLAAAVVTGSTRPTSWSPVLAALDEGGPVPDREPERVPVTRAQPTRPDAQDVRAVWESARPVTADPVVAAWLRSRGLDPAAVAADDLARALPRTREALVAVEERAGMRGETGPASAEARAMAGMPAWAAMGSRPWHDGWRLLLPVWDHTGRMVSLRARWCVGGEARVKEHGGTGISHGPGVYACRVARGIWHRRKPAGAPAWEGGPAWTGRVVVVEGGPDWLTWATHRHERGTAVLGLWSGALPERAAASYLSALPPWASVEVATDDDDAGRRYAEAVMGAAQAVGLLAVRREVR